MAPNLILVPSKTELARLRKRIGSLPASWRIETCGWGILASAVQSTEHIHRHRPHQVILAGIAGTFSETAFPVGSAVAFDSVRIDGLGASWASEFQTAEQLGWGAETLCVPGLFKLKLLSDRTGVEGLELLTVCSASGDENHARWRVARFPNVVAEDMEGYAVAASCHRANVPVSIVRGISNVAGVRDQSRWQIDRSDSSCRRDLIATH